MSGSIRLYGGSRASMPRLAERAPGWCVDTQELFIGTGAGNLLLASGRGAQGQFDRLTLTPGAALEDGQMGVSAQGAPVFMENGRARRLAFRAPSVPALAASADLAALIGAYNVLLEALKTGNVMEVSD